MKIIHQNYNWSNNLKCFSNSAITLSSWLLHNLPYLLSIISPSLIITSSLHHSTVQSSSSIHPTIIMNPLHYLSSSLWYTPSQRSITSFLHDLTSTSEQWSLHHLSIAPSLHCFLITSSLHRSHARKQSKFQVIDFCRCWKKR
jgi:hypothetical protein